jgi:hypothetical protein
MPYPHVIISWLVLLACAALLGALREKLVVPRLGDAAGRAFMSLAFITTIFLVSDVLTDMTGLSGAKALHAGLIWLFLTVCWEIFMGRVLMKMQWRKIFADYNIFRGRLWPLVLAATLIAPYLTS